MVVNSGDGHTNTHTGFQGFQGLKVFIRQKMSLSSRSSYRSLPITKPKCLYLWYHKSTHTQRCRGRSCRQQFRPLHKPTWRCSRDVELLPPRSSSSSRNSNRNVHPTRSTWSPAPAAAAPAVCLTCPRNDTFVDNLREAAKFCPGSAREVSPKPVPQPDARGQRHPCRVRHSVDNQRERLAAAAGQVSSPDGRFLSRHRPPRVRKKHKNKKGIANYSSHF